MKKTILLVEDDSNDVLLLQRALKQSGVGVDLQVVSKGSEAIKYLEGQGHFVDRSKFPLPDMVLLDMMLPMKSGLEVLRFIRHTQFLKNLVVIILTSSQDGNDMQRAYVLGANCYLIKPADFNESKKQITQICKYWLNTLPTPALQPQS